MKKLLAVALCCLVITVWAEAQEEPEPEEPQVAEAEEQEDESEGPKTYREQYEEYQKQAKKAIEYPWFAGGLFGVAFGSETSYVEVSPIASYRFSRRFQLGTRLTFRYRKDKRFDPDLSTTDVGAAILGRFYILDPVYLQAEVERLDWEYIGFDGTDYVAVQDTYTGYYAGFGFVQRASNRVAMYMSFLWDFAYDDTEPSPNSHPWLIRIGFGYTF